MMLAPEQFRDGPIQVRCNVCDLPATVTIEMLENINGTPFDARAWHMRQSADVALERAVEGDVNEV